MSSDSSPTPPPESREGSAQQDLMAAAAHLSGRAEDAVQLLWDTIQHTVQDRELRRIALNLLEASVIARTAGDKLQASDSRYRNLFESIEDGFCIIEVLFDEHDRPVDYVFRETNPAFEKHTGLSDAVGRRIREMVPNHDAHWFETYGRIARTGEPAHFEQAAAALGRVYEVYACRIGEPGQNQVAVLFKDVTVRRRSEAVLQESEALRSYVPRLANALRPLDNPSEVMDTAARILGEHLHAQRAGYAEAHGGETITVDRCYLNGASSLDGTYRYQDYGSGLLREFEAGHTVIRPDIPGDPWLTDEEKWNHAALGIGASVNSPLVKGGRLVAVFFCHSREPRAWTPQEIAIIDETAERTWAAVVRARAESALRQSEELQKLIVENAREYAIFSMTTERIITTWNSGAEAILGYTAEEAIGQSADWIFTPGDRAEKVPELEAERALSDGRATDERWHLRKDGSRLWGSGVMMAMTNGGGHPIGLLKIFRDQTAERHAHEELEKSRVELWQALQETQQAQEQAEIARRAKDHFLAVLSHELRTPLTPVLMAARTLTQQKDLPQNVVDALKMITRNVQLEARFIDDLLDVTRIERGKLEMQFEDVDLHEVLRDACEVTAPDFDEKLQELAVEMKAELFKLEGDRTRLQQVFWNLLKNASKFTPNGGVIRLETWNDNAGNFCAHIVDTGLGFSAEVSTHIFDPFAQADREVTRRYGGLGLGLAIAKAAVEGHGGTLRAESPGPDQGATFTVTLPLQASAST